MKTAVIALTKKGSKLAVKLGQELYADIYIKKEFIEKDAAPKSIFPLNIDFMKHVGDIFNSYQGVVFIMACGIAVRAIAPHLKDKRTDPAVVVLDEKGCFVISLLSGHLGGANRLAGEIAIKTGGTSVITTSTDVNDVLAFDLFAKRNDCIIENFEMLKFISSELVNGGCVGLASGCIVSGQLPNNIINIEEVEKTSCKYSVLISNNTFEAKNSCEILILRPRNLILGIGCKKGTSKEQISIAVDDFMEKNKKSLLSLKHISTIDLKSNEAGLLGFCGERGLELKIVIREDIKRVESNYTGSDFVKTNIGVASVAEPCAVLSGENAKLVCKKTVYNGITLALSEEEKVLYI